MRGTRCLVAGLWLAGLVVNGPETVRACTTAVVAGSATSDGRPLLWKNRDTDDRRNQAVYCADGKFAYVGVVNGGDAAGLDIWAGINSRGFAIMNAASYNLPGGEDTRGEGRFMKLALQSCATVRDFQALLEKTESGKRDVSANFGVIDAEGEAAIFETGPSGYKKFSASDPALAPRGYLVRTNFSESGDREAGTGLLRRDRAVALLEDLIGSGRLSAGSLLAEAARDVSNGRLGSFPLQNRKKGPVWAYTGDSICRYDTTSAFVAAGARPGEDPLRATAWVLLGQPLCGVAVPLWVAAESVPQEVAAGSENAPLGAAATAIQEVFYPDRRGDLAKYLDVQALTDPKRGWVTGLLALESANVQAASRQMDLWLQVPPLPEAVAAFQNQLAKQTVEGMQSLLQPPSPPAGHR